jgi:hypothetical protein
MALSQLAEEKAPELSVCASDFEKIQIDLFIPGLSMSPSTNNQGETFTSLSMGDYGFTLEEGNPQLPAIREFLEIPYGASCSVRLVDPAYAEIQLEHRVLPRQAPVPKIEGARANASFKINDSVYSAQGFCLNEEISFETLGFIRGSRVGMLEIFPVNYNPATGFLKVLTSASIEITLEGADPSLTRSMMERYATPGFERLASKLFKNSGFFRAHLKLPKDSGSRNTGFLIIAHTLFVNHQSLQDFKAHKDSLGFEVTVVSSTEAGSTKQNIKDYIKDAVENWKVPPAFLVLVGDTNHISHWNGSGSYNPATDLNYACIRGSDYFPDIFIGRFSVASTTQLENLVQKVLDMETVNTKKAVFMASVDNYNISEGTHNYVINTHLDPDTWSCDKLYCKTYNAQTYQVSNAFNDGRTLGVFSGHGWSGGWGDGPPFDQSNVKALTNTIYPIVLSFSCSTGAYSTGECFAETWIRDDHGATVFYGSSESSYWSEDDILERRMIDGWYDHGLERFAEMADYGMYKTYQYIGSGSWARMYYEMYNTMGDPSIKVLAEELGGEFSNFGTGIASPAYGQPTLTGDGDLTPGGLGFKLMWESVRPLAYGVIFIGSETIPGGMPLKGGFLYPNPDYGSIGMYAGTSGEVTVHSKLPPDFPTNSHVYVQTFFIDDTGPQGVTATDCLDAWIY